MSKAAKQVQAKLEKFFSKRPSFNLWMQLQWLVIEAHDAECYEVLLPWMLKELEAWPDELRVTSSVNHVYTPLARTYRLGLTTVNPTTAWIAQNICPLADPRLSHIVGLELDYMGQSSHNLLPAVREVFSELTFLHLNYAQREERYPDKQLAAFREALEQWGPTLRELVLTPPSNTLARSPAVDMVAVITELAEAGELSELRLLDVDTKWNLSAARAVLDCAALDELRMLSIRSVHEDSELVDAVLARPASACLLGLRLEHLGKKECARLKEAPLLQGVRFADYHRDAASSSWDWGSAWAGLSTLLASGQHNLTKDPVLTLHDIDSVDDLRKLFGDQEGWQSWAHVKMVDVDGLPTEALDVLLQHGVEIFPSLHGLSLRERAAPEMFERIVSSPLAAQVERIAWFAPRLRAAPDLAERWLATLSNDDLPLRYRKRYFDDFRIELDQLSVKDLNQLAGRLGLGPRSRLNKAQLLALVHDTVPAEVTDPEGMVESCHELQYL